jgi:hypothetical protein
MTRTRAENNLQDALNFAHEEVQTRYADVEDIDLSGAAADPEASSQDFSAKSFSELLLEVLGLSDDGREKLHP